MKSLPKFLLILAMVVLSLSLMAGACGSKKETIKDEAKPTEVPKETSAKEAPIKDPEKKDTAIKDAPPKETAKPIASKEPVKESPAKDTSPKPTAKPTGPAPQGAQAVFEKRCSKCHPTNKVLDRKETPQIWRTVVQRMQLKFASGISDEDMETIVKYLSSTRGR